MSKMLYIKYKNERRIKKLRRTEMRIVINDIILHDFFDFVCVTHLSPGGGGNSICWGGEAIFLVCVLSQVCFSTS